MNLSNQKGFSPINIILGIIVTLILLFILYLAFINTLVRNKQSNSSDKSISQPQSYINKGYGYTVQLPQGWKVTTDYGDYINIESASGNVIVSIRTKDKFQDEDLNLFFERGVDDLKSRRQNVNIIDTTDINLGKIPAKKTTYTYKVVPTDQKTPIGIIVLALGSNRYNYIINFGVLSNDTNTEEELYKLNNPKFKELLDSFTEQPII